MTPSAPHPTQTLAILGATGGTGKLLVRQALDSGHRVIAIVRDPAKLDTVHDRLQIEVADVTDAASLQPLLSDADAVLSALGSDGDDLCQRAMTSVLNALVDPRGTRIVAISAQPVGRGDDGPALWQRLILIPIIRLIYRRAYADLARMEAVLTASAAQWSVVRPPYLTDDPPTNAYKLRFDATPRGNLSIARADLAQAMLTILDDESTHRGFLGIASP